MTKNICISSLRSCVRVAASSKVFLGEWLSSICSFGASHVTVRLCFPVDAQRFCSQLEGPSCCVSSMCDLRHKI